MPVLLSSLQRSRTGIGKCRSIIFTVKRISLRIIWLIWAMILLWVPMFSCILMLNSCTG
ncbi:hypothetical protein LINPERPRIM_LOCUS30917 [Linum perenne]